MVWEYFCTISEWPALLQNVSLRAWREFIVLAQSSPTLHKLICNLTFLPLPNIHSVCITQPTQNPSYFWTYTNQNSSILLQSYYLLSCNRIYTSAAQDENTLLYKNPCLATCSALEQKGSEHQFDGHSLFVLYWLLHTEILSPQVKRKEEIPYLISVTCTCVPDLLDEVKY